MTATAPTHHHATPNQIMKRAIALEHEAESYASVGLNWRARDLRADARNLRQLARQASAQMGRLGE